MGVTGTGAGVGADRPGPAHEEPPAEPRTSAFFCHRSASGKGFTRADTGKVGRTRRSGGPGEGPASPESSHFAGAPHPSLSSESPTVQNNLGKYFANLW